MNLTQVSILRLIKPKTLAFYGVPRCPTMSNGVQPCPTMSNDVLRCSPVQIRQNSVRGFWRSTLNQWFPTLQSSVDHPKFFSRLLAIHTEPAVARITVQSRSSTILFACFGDLHWTNGVLPFPAASHGVQCRPTLQSSLDYPKFSSWLFVIQNGLYQRDTELGIELLCNVCTYQCSRFLKINQLINLRKQTMPSTSTKIPRLYENIYVNNGRQ